MSTSSEAVANSSLNSVDDDTDTCFATMTESNPWWVVDLEQNYTITSVVITNHNLGGTCMPQFVNAKLSTYRALAMAFVAYTITRAFF